MVNGQDTKAAQIPDNINQIFKTSCTPCHWEGGKAMALKMVNFSKWTDYDVVKGGKKAGMVCYVLNKEKMPPKSVRKGTPEMIPTKEQVDAICKWAESVKVKK
jgi:hypothetical protein